MKQYKHPYSVTTCFIDHNGRLLLLKRAKKDSQFGLWGIPGGKVERDETPEDGLTREVEEELGLKISKKELVFLEKTQMKNSCDGQYLLYLFYYKLSNFPKIYLNELEHSKYSWTELEDFKQYPLLFSQGKAFDLVKNQLEKLIESKGEECLIGIR